MLTFHSDTDRGDCTATAESHHNSGKDCRVQTTASDAESPSLEGEREGGKGGGGGGEEREREK